MRVALPVVSKDRAVRSSAAFARAGGGTLFEYKVAAVIAAELVTGRRSLVGGRPVALEFQTDVPGFDDFRVVVESGAHFTATVDVQCRFRQSLTGVDKKFSALVQAGLVDVRSDASSFSTGSRRLALIVDQGSPAHRDLRELVVLARSGGWRTFRSTLAKAPSRVRARWDHLCDALGGVAQRDVWLLARALDVVAVDLRDEQASGVVDAVNNLGALWSPNDTERGRDTFNELFVLACEIGPRGGVVDEALVRQRLRGLPPAAAAATRRTRLQRMAMASRERVVAALRALGVSDDDQLDALADHIFKVPIPDDMPSIELIEGDMGVGKSAELERRLHAAIAKSIADPLQPIPVRIHASELGSRSLLDLAVAHTSSLGDPHAVGVSLVVDGLDEAALEPGSLASDASALVAQLSGSTVVLASRPTNASHGLPKRPIKPLDDDALAELLEVLGQPPQLRWARPELVETLRRPLFAILYSVHRASNAASPAELIGRMAEAGLSDLALRLPRALHPLTRLGAALMDGAGRAVPLADLELDLVDRAQLMASRLVRVEELTVTFQVAALSEWFAGQALLADDQTARAVAEDPERARLWRYAIASALAQVVPSKVDAFVEALVSTNPAIARWALSESTVSSISAEVPPPSSSEAARALNNTFTHWYAALAPISSLWRLRKEKPPLLGVRTADQGIVTAHIAEDELEIHFAKHSIFGVGSADEFEPPMPGVTWIPFRFGGRAGGVGWAWEWTADEFVSLMDSMFSSGSFAAGSSALHPELEWFFACTIAGARRPTGDTIEIADLQAIVDHYRSGVGQGAVVSVSSGSGSWPVAGAQRLLDALRAKGQSQCQAPWPRVRRMYRADDQVPVEAIVQGLNSISMAALNGYKEIVEQWIPNLAPYLHVYALLPAVLRGRVYMGPSRSAEGVRDLSYMWYLEPSSDAHNRGNWELTETESPFEYIDYDALRASYARARPAHARTLFPSVTMGEGPWEAAMPATRAALELLAQDLAEYKWSTKSLGHHSEQRVIEPRYTAQPS